MRGSSRRSGLVLAAVVGAVLVLLTPQPAHAAVALAEGSVHTAKTGTDYTYATSFSAWSAVAVYSAANYNVSLFDSGGGWFSSSYGYGYGKTEFIAVNSHLRAPAAYQASTVRAVGTGLGYTQWRQARTRTVLPHPANDGVSGPSDPDIAFAVLDSRDVVSVSDIYLLAGESFWVNEPTRDLSFFLLESNPYDASTTIRNRVQAATGTAIRTSGGCALYRANHTGWHGLLMVSNTAPVTTTPAGGMAVTLHRLDPARPDTCPQRNFPDPTPPGL